MPRQTALQTRVDADVARLAREAAAREGEDVSNWLRRLVTRELRPSVMIEAWTRPIGDRRDDGLNPERKAEFFLVPTSREGNLIATNDRDFVIYETPSRRLSEAEHRKNGPFWLELERRWVFLRGSPTPWASAGHTQYLDGRYVVTLRRLG
jgi:hypothetical protein